MSRYTSLSKNDSSATSSNLNSKYYKTGFFESKGSIGVYANRTKNLSPNVQLNLVKKYNTKINTYNLDNVQTNNQKKQDHQNFESSLIDNLKENIQSIQERNINSPTYRITDTLTQQSQKESFRCQMKQSPLSVIDNIRELNNVKTEVNYKSRVSKINYETEEKQWKPSVKKIELKTENQNSETEYNKKRESQSVSRRNPITGEEQQTIQVYRQKITSPLSSYLSNTESKKLIEYHYGTELVKENNQPLTIKCNQINERDRIPNTNIAQEFGKKKSQFISDVPTILRK